MSSRWRVGILGQALIPLVAGTCVIVAVETWLGYRREVDARRIAAISALERDSAERTRAGQGYVDRVARQLVQCRAILTERLANPAPSGWQRDADGIVHRLPAPDDPPIAVFVSPAADAHQEAAAAAAYRLLAEYGPAFADGADDLIVAVPGRWLAGWGGRPVDLVGTMLPGDPVLLPVERALLDNPGPVRWSQPYFEPGTDRWTVAATAAIDVPGVGRMAVTRLLSMEALVGSVTSHAEGTESALWDSDGRLVAHSRLEREIRASGGTLTLERSTDSFLRALWSGLPRSGPAQDLVRSPDGRGWLGVSRFPGLGWTLATLHPDGRIEGPARAAAIEVLITGLVVVLAQIAILVLVLRLRVARPLAELSGATAALAAGRTAGPLDVRRTDEIGDLSRDFTAMADAVTRREHELQAANQALQERERLARALIEGAADAVLILADGRVAAANARAVVMFGLPVERILGLRPSDLSPELQADGTPSVQAAEQLLTAVAVRGSIHVPWLHRHADGTVIETEIGLAVIADHGRILALIRDVGERNRMEERLRQGQKLESLGQLAGGIAHDFNNTLAAIIGSADLMQRMPAGDPRHARMVQSVLASAESAAGLVRKLLAFARKSGHARTAVDVNQAVRDAVVMLQHGIGNGVTVEVALEPHRGMVLGDAAMLQSAVLNLGLNARDAMPNGGALRIATRWIQPGSDATSPAGGQVEITVADTGTGIPPEIRARIFEPFFTTKAPGKGTGLGLAMVWGMVRDHGGSIDVVSTIGVGTTFRILLPVQDAVPAGADPPARGAVLIAEDDPLLRGLAAQLVRDLGWEPIEAVDGAEAVELAVRQGDRIAVALLDLDMPRLDGVGCLRELRRLLPDLPVVLCTGADPGASSPDIEAFTARLPKPFRVAELARILDAVAVRQ